MRNVFPLILAWLLAAMPAPAAAQEKLSDDPTKVITKLGFRYSNTTSTVSGSLALGPVNMINASYSANGEWRVGVSRLFSFGIVNLSASQRELTGGTTQTLYSVGGFLPLSVLVDTGQWQLFPTAGYNYAETTIPVFDEFLQDFVSVPLTNNSGYVGLLALRPLSDKWTFLGGGFAVAGSDDYSGYSVGAGVTYNLTDRDSLTAFASYVDNTFGTREVFGIGYKREFGGGR